MPALRQWLVLILPVCGAQGFSTSFTLNMTRNSTPLLSFMYSENITASLTISPLVMGQLNPNPLLTLSAEQVWMARRILSIMSYVILVVSLPLTACNVIVFLHKSMRSATSTYVVTLSLAQVLYLIMSTGFTIVNSLTDNPRTSLFYWMYAFYIGTYMSTVVRRASYVVMCLVSLERLYAIVRPLHVKGFVLVRYPVLIVCAIFSLSLLWHSYIVAKNEIMEIRSSSNQVTYTAIFTSLYLKTGEVNDGFGLAAKFVLEYAVLALQLLLSVLTIWGLRRHKMATKKIQTTIGDDVLKRREFQMTLTILGTTISYVVISLPMAFHSLFSTTVGEYRTGKTYGYLFQVMELTVINISQLSCSTDFVCFIILSSSYRKTFCTVFGLKRARLSASQASERTTEFSALDSGTN